MKTEKKGLNTVCTHAGSLEDQTYKGAISPLYMSTSYAFEDVPVKRYPRYYNTPNQEGLSNKIAALENAEAGMIFGSGMAAISTTVLAFLEKGDHVVFQRMLYGGTHNFIVSQLEKFGISYSFTEGLAPGDFQKAIRSNTKVLYVETPSNPLLTITDLKAVADICREKGIVSMIDNTFASPVNQNPLDFGIDISIHSATKYMGGHSDICAGAVACSQAHKEEIHKMGICLGGSLSDYTVWLLDRSIKTMGLRVSRQNENAMKMASYLNDHGNVSRVYYPGLAGHEGHELARSQMKGFGGMLSFELDEGIDPVAFRKALKLIKSSMSLAGVESTVLSPAETSHALLSPQERVEQGISDGLIRFSVGIEETEDLIADMEQAFMQVAEQKVSIN